MAYNTVQLDKILKNKPFDLNLDTVDRGVDHLLGEDLPEHIRT